MFYKKIHFIGIGGVHMSGLAEMCALFGSSVSGSDVKESDNTARLRAKGIPVSIGHGAGNIDPTANLIVYTSAVKPDNPEFMRCKELGLPIVDKARLLGRVMEKYRHRICVSGSHGKTTTTAMIAETLYGLGLDPTIMNGGICTRLQASMRLGGTEYFVSEADEYYDAFLKMKPTIGIILNISYDHTDYFPTYKALRESFRKFAESIDRKGALIIHGNIPDIDSLTMGLECSVIIYGGSRGHWQAGAMNFDRGGLPAFRALYQGKDMGLVHLAVPGAHNVDNALATLAVCHFLGAEGAAGELALFKGAGRRFQPRGFLNGAAVFDDYAHHPKEVRATLEAARPLLLSKNSSEEERGRLICVFQPHTRSRTLELLDEFVSCLLDADKVLLLNIFTPAGREESHIPISSEDLCSRLKSLGQDALTCPSFEEAARHLREFCRPGDVVLLMGAGDIVEMMLEG